MARGPDPSGKAPKRQASEGQSVGERVQNFLGEFRLIAPGLAALLGFQLTVAFQESFQRLDMLDKALNFAGVACTATALLFLLVPAGYHRFTGELEETEAFLQYARRNIAAAFGFLPVGLSLALYVQAVRTFASHTAAAFVAATSLAAFALAWWILPFLRASRRGRLLRQGPEV